MAVYHTISGAGWAWYYPDGHFITYDLKGDLVNNGTYKIEDGKSLCYEYETYDYPPDASDTCNSFYVQEASNGEEETSFMGCEIFGDKCYTSCDGHWANWYVGRVSK